MQRFFVGACFIALLLPAAMAIALPPGFVQGDVVSHSYVPNKTWTQAEGFGICPYLVEYEVMKHNSDDEPLENFHEENIRRIDMISQWSTAVMLYAREDMFRDELINLMIRCYHNRQLIVIRDYWNPDNPDVYLNTIHILEKLWENRDVTLTSPEGEEATGRQLINNILMVKLGDEGLHVYGTDGLEQAHEAFKTRVKYLEMDGEQPFTHIKTWYNMIGYRVGSYAATQQDIDDHDRLKIPSNCEFIGTDVYHYWSWQWGSADPETMTKSQIWNQANSWQDIITRYYPEGLDMGAGDAWTPSTSDETHAMMGAIDLAGASDAIMFYIPNSSGLNGSAYATPVETMDAFYRNIRIGPWVGLCWWMWGRDGSHYGTRSYPEKTLYHYTQANTDGEPYSDARMDELHDQFIASRLRMFNDVVYRQFADLNPIEDQPDEVNLGITADGCNFTLDGEPTFLQGLSYYGGMTVSDPLELAADLDDMVAEGFNWIRLWAYWQYPDDGEDVSVLTHDGQVRQTYMDRLKALLTACNQRGIVVDVSIPFDGNGDWVGPRTYEEHLAAVRTLATELKPWRNVYIDIANERDVGDDRYVSLEHVGRLIDAIKVIDSLRLCTASSVPVSSGDLLDHLRIGKMDFIAPHLPRTEGSAAETLGTVKEYAEWMDGFDWRVPIHLQEPFRRGYTTYNPTTDDFLRDCSGAKVGEAAGWCLHNGADAATADKRPWRCFNMSDSEGRLYDQLDSQEKAATAAMSETIGGVDPDVRRYQAEYTEQLAHQVGSRVDDVWVTGSGDNAAFLSYGPYVETIPAGNHLARWRLKVDGDVNATSLVFTIDVVTDAGQVTLTSRQIQRQEFPEAGQWVEFDMPFTSQGGDMLEFRTFWHGVGQVSLDRIDLIVNYMEEPVAACQTGWLNYGVK